MIVVDATREMKRQFYGYVPRCRAWAAVEGDRVVAMAGYKVDNARVHVFADLSDEIRRHPIKMVRTGRLLVQEALTKNMPVQVIADQSVPRSREFLLRLGFEERHE